MSHQRQRVRKIKRHTIFDPGIQINSRDKILLDNKPLVELYILFRKPAGYVTTRQDEFGRKTVYDLLEDIDDWLFPVGRLDRNSEGLLIFTNVLPSETDSQTRKITSQGHTRY